MERRGCGRRCNSGRLAGTLCPAAWTPPRTRCRPPRGRRRPAGASPESPYRPHLRLLTVGVGPSDRVLDRLLETVGLQHPGGLLLVVAEQPVPLRGELVFTAAIAPNLAVLGGLLGFQPRLEPPGVLGDGVVHRDAVV